MTESAVLPVMKHVKSKLAPDDLGSRLVEEMKSTIWADLEQRYSDEVSKLLSICSFLDLRFKDQHLEDKEIVASITEECIKYFESVHPTETAQSQSAEDGALSDSPPAKRLRGLAAVLKQIPDNDGSTLSSRTPTPR